MSGGLNDAGEYIQPSPMGPFDLDPQENPADFYEDAETGPRPKFPVPAYAGGGQNTASNAYDDVDFDAYGAASREWVRAAQDANRDGKPWPPWPEINDYRVTS